MDKMRDKLRSESTPDATNEREADATSEETLEDLEASQAGIATGQSAQTTEDATTSVPAPDGSPDVARDARISDGSAGDPM